MAKQNVLVVDDQKNVRTILEFNLKRNGFEVITAEDGEEALLAAEKNLPALMLLDIMMPGIDGFQVLEKLKANEKTASIPVLVVSAKGTEDDILRAMKLGARDYVVKPFNLELLVQKVYRLLDQNAPPEPAENVAPDYEPAFPIFTVFSLRESFPEDLKTLEEDLLRNAANKPRSIILDIQGIDDVETLEFGNLARIQQAVKKSGSVLKLFTDQPNHITTLKESGFGKHFDIIENVTDLMEELNNG